MNATLLIGVDVNVDANANADVNADAIAADTPPHRALIGFGQVRHTRLRPTHHAFAYPTYFLMLPMRSLGAASVGGATDRLGGLARNRRALLSFYDCDHGDGRSDALAWLDELLANEGIAPCAGEVWLHTYPRVLGYTFKPVSFWYCHDVGGALRAIVVEVNNTFGERHCYLLDAPRLGEEMTAKKVFHVSPFCTLEGSYRFRFMLSGAAQPGAPWRHTLARIDYDDACAALLQTSVSGTLEAICAANLRKAFWRFPAMTFGVVAHIHWQAFKLWRKRVPFVGKPDSPDSPDAFVTR